MVRASWTGVVLAEADRTVVVEGNHYFPPDAVDFDRLRPRVTRSLCFWKGARYYDVVVDGDVNATAAWSYAHPSLLARRIRRHVAFWNGVRVEEIPPRDVLGGRRPLFEQLVAAEVTRTAAAFAGGGSPDASSMAVTRATARSARASGVMATTE